MHTRRSTHPRAHPKRFFGAGRDRRSRLSDSWRRQLAPAVFSLNHPAKYVHWHFFQMSVANIVVILLMIAVFVAAILLPFPRRRP